MPGGVRSTGSAAAPRQVRVAAPESGRLVAPLFYRGEGGERHRAGELAVDPFVWMGLREAGAARHPGVEGRASGHLYSMAETIPPPPKGVSGTGRVSVDLAAAGTRFTDGYRDARTRVQLEPDQPRGFSLETDFEPDQVVVDPRRHAAADRPHGRAPVAVAAGLSAARVDWR
jgi:hypothetical protein